MKPSATCPSTCCALSKPRRAIAASPRRRWSWAPPSRRSASRSSAWKNSWARLFDRIYRGIELTEGGAMLFEQVQLGLQNIDAGLSAISTQQQHEVLQVATDFAFAAYWLMPRLHRFHEANRRWMSAW
jgi:hypothetical protein